jgi:hypothetical protein
VRWCRPPPPHSLRWPLCHPLPGILLLLRLLSIINFILKFSNIFKIFSFGS